MTQALVVWVRRGRSPGQIWKIVNPEGRCRAVKVKRVNPRCLEKPLASGKVPVPQTDTGGHVENTKVIERTLAKELGK